VQVSVDVQNKLSTPRFGIRNSRAFLLFFIFMAVLLNENKRNSVAPSRSDKSIPEISMTGRLLMFR
jgi:hypothetical protein